MMLFVDVRHFWSFSTMIYPYRSINQSAFKDSSFVSLMSRLLFNYMVRNSYLE